jgi:hypothetical protein
MRKVTSRNLPKDRFFLGFSGASGAAVCPAARGAAEAAELGFGWEVAGLVVT